MSEENKPTPQSEADKEKELAAKRNAFLRYMTIIFAVAFLLVLTAGVILLLRVFSAAGSAAQRFSGLLSQCGLDSTLYLPVCKALGVAVVVRVMSALCKDAGQSALAAKMEIAGAVLTLSVCLPLFEQVLDLITEWAV